MIAPQPFRLFLNPRHGVPGVVVLPEGGFRRAAAEIRAWPGYAATPLHALPAMAAAAGVASVHYKDEAGRFGLGSFKALGGGYAASRAVVAALARGPVPMASAASVARGAHAAEAARITLTCATDGNHGRAVAWGARRCGARCVIFVHAGVSQGRRAAIAAYGAEIREVAGHYDDAVREAASVAAREGWLVVSDTSWPGYTELPRDVMQGYRLMAAEALEALPAAPTHIFIQSGVGGVAAAVSVQARHQAPGARVVVVEPEHAACLLASAEAGAPVAVPGALETIMAGLACGAPSLLAWQELERAGFAFMAVPDATVAPLMRALAQGAPGLGTPPLVAGESAVAGLAGLLLAAGQGEVGEGGVGARRALGLDAGSRVLVFGTEGATDPALYAALLGAPA